MASRLSYEVEIDSSELHVAWVEIVRRGRIPRFRHEFPDKGPLLPP